MRLLDTGEEKIGISKDSMIRKNQIEKSLGTKMEILHEVKIFHALKNEKRLQDLYQKKWIPRYSGNGSKEIFDLNFLNVFFIQIRMDWIWIRQRVKILFCVLVLGFIAFNLFTQYSLKF